MIINEMKTAAPSRILSPSLTTSGCVRENQQYGWKQSESVQSRRKIKPVLLQMPETSETVQSSRRTKPVIVQMPETSEIVQSGRRTKPVIVQMPETLETEVDPVLPSDFNISSICKNENSGEMNQKTLNNFMFLDHNVFSDVTEKFKSYKNNGDLILKSKWSRNKNGCADKSRPDTDNKNYSQNVSDSNNSKNENTLLNCSIVLNTSDEVSPQTKTDIYEVSNSEFVVIMKPHSILFLVGVVEVEMLKGSIQIMGYTMKEEKEKILVYSLQGSSHLFLKALPHENITSASIIQKYLLHKIPKKSYLNLLKESATSSIFLIRRKKNHRSLEVWPNFFQNQLSFSIFPPKDLLDEETRICHKIEHKIGCILDTNLTNLGLKEMTEIPEWIDIEEEITSQVTGYPKVLLCGGKSVGKSTLLRYLINKFVQKWKKLLVIDFDPGQCEFTIGGCISVTLIEDPVFGPNFTHLKEPLRSIFIGEVDVTKAPEAYIEGCKYLINISETDHNNMPWLINTMGFTKGFGVMLTCGIIRSASPTHVIQIESKDRKLNFPSHLSMGFVYSQDVESFISESDSQDFKNYLLYTIPSAHEQLEKVSLRTRGPSPAEARNLVILSYFSSMLSLETTSLSQVTPYMVNMESINLKTTTKNNLNKSEIAAAINGNMVALCHEEDGELFPHCHGFGIVRGIDWKSGTIFLITPVPSHTLTRVNCLIKGSIVLPESVYYNQRDQVEGCVPYLAYNSGGSTSKFAKRDFRLLPTSRSQQR